MRFILSCNCGKTVTVSEGDAGASIDCATCGRTIEIPSLGDLRELPRAFDESELSDTSMPPHYRLAAVIASIVLIGLGGVVFLVGVALFLGNVTGFFPTVPLAGYGVMTAGVAIMGGGFRALAENRGGN
jgi:hypothetical protein